MDDVESANRAEPEPPDWEKLISVYANNVKFEMTAWDLRIMFGQLMPISEGKGQVDWHTDVTIPWAQAKLMNFFLSMNIALYERDNGKIHIPATVMPSPMSSPPKGVDTANPEAIETFNMVQALIKEFRDRQQNK